MHATVDNTPLLSGIVCLLCWMSLQILGNPAWSITEVINEQNNKMFDIWQIVLPDADSFTVVSTIQYIIIKIS